jgi:protein-tyrosine phosphatase
MPVTEVVKVDSKEQYAETIRRAAGVLGDGGLVVFPTETVYGVGARADLPEAVGRLRETKGRQGGKPFTVHIGRRDDVHRFVPALCPTGRRLVQKGWPGPLTLIFTVDAPASASVLTTLESPEAAMSAMYAEGTIGLRCPDDPTAADLLAAVDAPVVAASANRPGRRPPHDARGALAELDGKVDLVLDAGPARYAKASTIVRVNSRSYEVVREGVYDERMLRRLATLNVLLVCTGNTCRSPMGEGLFRKLAAESLGIRPEDMESHGIRVCSAGTSAGSGAVATAQAIQVMQEYDVDISQHRSQPLTAELIHQADCILTMTTSHRDTVLRMVPGAESRCRVIGEQQDIEDPIGQPVEVYAECARQIERALKDRLAEILA